ncbi:MAG: transporter substrate-binding domain-containing protein [Desulfotignum sp.]|nr:transporter substrate-binding domain-containing protein [Desulfotignum sp.]
MKGSIMLPWKNNTGYKTMIQTTIYLVWVISVIITSPCSAAESKVHLSPEENAWISARHVVRVRIGNAPPFMLTNGEIRGMAIDYLTHVFSANGIAFAYIDGSEVSWPQALEYIKQHDIVDMVPTAKITENRKKDLLFTKEYIFAPWVIFTRTDSDFISSIDDLNGKTVSVEEGFVMHQWLKRDYPGIILKVVSADVKDYAEIPVKNLSTGLVDAYIGNLLSTTYIVQTKGYANIKVAAPTPFGDHNQAMAIRNDWPELAGIINKTLAAMTPDEHAAIRNRWLSIRYEYGIDKIYVLKWVIGVAGIAALFIGVVLLWNKRLTAEVAYRKTVEIALRESENHISSIFRSAPVGIGLVVDRVLRAVNSRICELTGYQEQELIGQSARIFYPSDADFEFVGREKYAQIADNGTGSVETYWQKKDGTVIDVLLSSTIVDLNDPSRGLTFTALDITERKRAEAEKEKLQAQLVQAQKMESVGRLAGGVAHDFNNMLGVILGHAELALLQIDEKTDLRVDLKAIQTAAKRSADITRQLLAFARKQTISPRQLDLNDTVETMLNMLRRLIGEDINLAWQPAKGLWPVKMDPSQVDQILANLCVNARDAIAGVGKLTIETGMKTFDPAYCADHAGFIPGDFVMLAVSDNGCGMDKETMKHLFEPFFTTKDIGKGTGLGLATIYGIVKQNNGFINVYSEPDQGSTFRIYLPRYAAADEIPAGVHPDKPDPTGNETILLVEDEPAILRMTRIMLKEKGYSVLPAATPGKAIDLAKTHDGKIDLLMTDVVMPEMNGQDLASELTALYPEIKRLFMSGYTANVIAHQGRLDQGVVFLQKPFSIQELAEKIRETLDKTC